MKVETKLQFIEMGRRNSKTGNRKVNKMWIERYESNGLVMPTFEMDSDGNLEITLWCHDGFIGDYDGYHFIFIKQPKNVVMEIYTKIEKDAE